MDREWQRDTWCWWLNPIGWGTQGKGMTQSVLERQQTMVKAWTKCSQHRGPHLFLDYSSLLEILDSSHFMKMNVSWVWGRALLAQESVQKHLCDYPGGSPGDPLDIWLHNSIKGGVADIKLLVCVCVWPNQGHREGWLDIAFVKSLCQANFFWRSTWLPDNTDAVSNISPCVCHPPMDTSMPRPSIWLFNYPPNHAYIHIFI